MQEENTKRKSKENQTLSLKTEFIYDKKAFFKRIVTTLSPKLLKAAAFILIGILCISIGINIFLLMDQLTFIGTMLTYQKAMELLTFSATSLLKISKSTINLYSLQYLNYSGINRDYEYIQILENQKNFHHYFYQTYPLLSTTDLKEEMYSDYYMNTYNHSYLNINRISYQNDTIFSIIDSVVANILQAANEKLPQNDYYFIIFNSVNSIFQFIRDKIEHLNVTLLSISNLTSDSRPIFMFAIVVATANMMFMLFFAFTFILSKYPVNLMSLWLEVPPQYLTSAHSKAEEYISTRNTVNKETVDAVDDEESENVNKQKEEDELISIALANKK